MLIKLTVCLLVAELGVGLRLSLIFFSVGKCKLKKFVVSCIVIVTKLLEALTPVW